MEGESKIYQEGEEFQIPLPAVVVIVVAIPVAEKRRKTGVFIRDFISFFVKKSYNLIKNGKLYDFFSFWE